MEICNKYIYPICALNLKAYILFPVLLLLFWNLSSAQSVCGTATENATLTLTAPSGYKFSNIQYASYGTPNGACDTYSNGGCHAANSASICSTAFVGKTSASIEASNAIFGDPCVGTVKRLYVQAGYSAILPLKLLAFNALMLRNDYIKLVWHTAEEINTEAFIVEYSANGISFNEVGRIASSGEASGEYAFQIKKGQGNESFFRLRMIDMDDKFQYSNIVRVNHPSHKDIQILNTGTHNSIIIASSERQEAVILNLQGQRLKKILLPGGMQTIKVSDLQKGWYLLSTAKLTLKFQIR